MTKCQKGSMMPINKNGKKGGEVATQICSAPGHKVYPCWLRHLPITRANPVWAPDTTYISMARGLVCRTAVVPLFGDQDRLRQDRQRLIFHGDGLLRGWRGLR